MHPTNPIPKKAARLRYPLFPEGTAIELIRESETGRAVLLAFDGKNHHVGHRTRIRGRVFEPVNVPESILGALALPTERAPYGSTRKLFTEISDLISRVTRLPKDIVVPFPYIVMATWLIERLPSAPLIWVTVPPTASCAAHSRRCFACCAGVHCTLQISLWPRCGPSRSR
jgi:hypothetical protein